VSGETTDGGDQGWKTDVLDRSKWRGTVEAVRVKEMEVRLCDDHCGGNKLFKTCY
jgi:hypothetical protein